MFLLQKTLPGQAIFNIFLPKIAKTLPGQAIFNFFEKKLEKSLSGQAFPAFSRIPELWRGQAGG